jgi:hypothetical protein
MVYSADYIYTQRLVGTNSDAGYVSDEILNNLDGEVKIA